MDYKVKKIKKKSKKIKRYNKKQNKLSKRKIYIGGSNNNYKSIFNKFINMITDYRTQIQEWSHTNNTNKGEREHIENDNQNKIVS